MSSVKDLDKYLFDKIETIKHLALLLDYIKGPNEVDTILQMQSDVFELNNVLSEIKALVKKQEEKIQELKTANQRLLTLNSTCVKLQVNNPSIDAVESAVVRNKDAEPFSSQHPICASDIKPSLIPRKSCYTTPNDLSSDEEEDRQIPTFDDIKKNSPHFCFYEIEHITPNEYASIPKYMKDEKTSLDRLNWAIDELNKAKDKKYAIILTAKTNLNERIRCAIREYRDQEIKGTQNVPFVVEKDLNEFTNFKLDKSGHKFMTIFRHCKRIKEVRGNNLTRYVFL